MSFGMKNSRSKREHPDLPGRPSKSRRPKPGVAQVPLPGPGALQKQQAVGSK